MENVSLGKKRLGAHIATLTLAVGSLISPVFAAASTVLPVQVLPPSSSKSCAQVTFDDLQAHVYNSNLDSFDITISDKSYVVVSTTVGDSPIPFNYISRWNNPDGSVRMHVDLQSMRLDHAIKVEITFLSAQSEANNGQVTCVFSVPATIRAIVPAASSGTANPVPTNGQGTGVPVTPGREQSVGTTSTTSVYNPGIVAAMNSLGNLCGDGGAKRLWAVLLVLFTLFVFTLCAQKFDPSSNIRDWNIGLILAVFAGLLIFWYVSVACRTGAWAPAIATFITIVGLLYTMLRKDDGEQILLLKDGKK